ncbi:hypothetical protein [Methylobacter sp. sgz302048]|uniref:hypothetical protein n=1 Tax=Methylobacter sp. sgz302048 TaxID=3455945 RepID=UPI003FA0EFB7
MTKFQKHTHQSHNLQNMPETTPDTVSIYTFSKKHKIQLLEFADFGYLEAYINDDEFDAGVHIPFEVFVEFADTEEECESIFGVLRVPVDDYEPQLDIIEHLHEIGKFGKICNKLLKFDWELPDNVRIQKIVLSPVGAMDTKLGSIERQFVITPSFVGGAV